MPGFVYRDVRVGSNMKMEHFFFKEQLLFKYAILWKCIVLTQQGFGSRRVTGVAPVSRGQ